jgi:hypothetical protein
MHRVLVVFLWLFAIPGDANLYCDSCVAVVQKIKALGCTGSAQTICHVPELAPYASMCQWIVTYFCTSIEDWLKTTGNATQVCEQMGTCSSPCQCGLCTVAIANKTSGRCLGFPYDCGHRGLWRPDLTVLGPQRVLGQPGREIVNPLGYCPAGRCGDANSTGCCLTCL